MAKISSKDQRALLFLGVIVGVPVLVFQKISEAGAWPLILGIVIIGVAAYLMVTHKNKANRLSMLRQKYGDESIVQKILSGTVWVEMSQDQLIDSIGSPAAIDQKHLKTKTREVWKYYPQGKSRYGLRITIDDGRVTGWDSKG
ncbi:hypothetical protein N7325_13555 [Stutzerimonas stutzeri]|jgi:hypothetical protein|uniref:hypothetical protein n=1 Tax=Stutzerimonas stutzeri TaxID=316 RepID=UPI00244C76BD|nr:hypothetical protein [Stutzerimonas stutzeri]MDH0120839.1 hypothetical protein [Stutzerimonas stutzeri]